MGEPAPPPIPVNKPSFNGQSTNLHEAFNLFHNQVKFLLVEGQYAKCDEMDKVRAILNWLGPKSFEVYEDLAIEPGEDKRKCEDVLKAFERYFKPTQSLFQNWYQLSGLYSGSCKSQGDFMMQLKEIAKECSFTNSDEFVKFLFLTHNQNSRVRDALLDRMKATDTPAQCLAIAKTVESTIETEKLSKSFLQDINKLESTEVDAVSKKKGFKGPGHEPSRGWQRCSHSKSMTNCRNCGSVHPPKKCPAYGKECFSCKKKGHFKQFCRSSQHKRSQSRGSDSRKSRKDMHDIDQDYDTSFQMQDYDSIDVLLYGLQLMFIGQHILTSSLMKSQVTGSFNVFSQM